MIRVLIVEDSPVMQMLLRYAISSDPVFEIVGIAENGEEAIAAASSLRPDVIAMDLQMPKMNGREATKIIMQSNPTPIVIVTSDTAAGEMQFSFSMMEAGALAIVKKPPAVDDPDYPFQVMMLRQTLRLMSEVKLVRRVSRSAPQPVQPKPLPLVGGHADGEIRVISIGASTGGPPVLQTILSKLPHDLPAPLLIVQHIAQGFTEGFVDWLRNTTNFPIRVAVQAERALPGHAYVAPDNFHMGVERGMRIVLSDHAPESNLRPAVSYLFRTTAQVFGSKAIGVLLTGMGRDGADDLKVMKDAGAITIAQDKESSVVHGMPGEAIKLNAAMHILPPEEIADLITILLKNQKPVPVQG